MIGYISFTAFVWSMSLVGMALGLKHVIETYICNNTNYKLYNFNSHLKRLYRSNKMEHLRQICIKAFKRGAGLGYI